MPTTGPPTTSENSGKSKVIDEKDSEIQSITTNTTAVPSTSKSTTATITSTSSGTKGH